MAEHDVHRARALAAGPRDGGRSERDSLATQGLWRYRVLTLAVAGTVGLQLATLYVPVLNRILKTAPLTGGELAICLALSSVAFIAVEGEKLLLRHGSGTPECAPRFD